MAWNLQSKRSAHQPRLSNRLSKWSELETNKSSFRLNSGTDNLNTFLFNFDHRFFDSLAEFQDAILLKEVNLDDMENGSSLTILTPAVLLEIMLREELEDYSFSEDISEVLYETFNDAVAEACLDETYKFYSKTSKPFGFNTVLDYYKRHDGGIQISDFYGDREHDTMVYVVTAGE